MIEKVTKSLIQSLKSELGDRCKYYTERIPQGAVKPFVSVLCVNATSVTSMKQRGKHRFSFVIRYFQKENDWKKFADTISDCVKYITIDGLMVVADSSAYHYSDDVLTVEVGYDLDLVKVQGQPSDAMNTLKVVRGMKDD